MKYITHLALAALLISAAAVVEATVPRAPKNVCAEDDASKCTEQPSTGGLKWHPGHYLLSDNGASLSRRLEYCDEVGKLSYMKGLQVRMYWAQLEPSQGNYDFSALRQLLTRCGNYGKRLMLEVWWRKFSKEGDPSGVIPAYLGTSNVYWTGDGYAATVWRPYVADRAIALFQALGKEFDSQPYFEMISTKETAAGGQAANVSDYTATAYVTQIKRLLTTARAAWPRTQVRLMANYVTAGSNTQMIDLIKHARDNQIIIGGPDICATADCKQTQAQNVLAGVIGGYDYRGDAGIIYNAEPASLYTPMYSLYDTAIKDQKANYLSWMRYWNTTYQDWENDIKPFLAKNPTTVSTCPRSMTCDTR